MSDKPIRVLIIEPDNADAQTIRQMLLDASTTSLAPVGFEPERVSQLSAGLERLARDGADAVLLEPLLPNSRGSDAVLRVRAQAPHIPLVVLSHIQDADFHREALHRGAQDCLVKGEVDSQFLARALCYALERQRAERPRRESEERFREIYAQSPIGVALCNPQGRVLDANRACLQILGVPSAAQIGHFQLFDQVGMSDMARARVDRGDTVRYETVLKTAEETEAESPETTYLDVLVTPLGSRMAGPLRGYLVQIQDITERKWVEAALRASEERFRSVAQTASDAIIIFDSHENIVFWNQAAREIFGYSADETIGQLLASVVTGRLHDAYQREAQRMLSAGERNLIGRIVEEMGVRRDGRAFPLEVSLAAWKSQDEVFFTVIARDVTERKQTEEALRQYTAELQARNEELDAFAHTVAHDLKNPLALTVGYVDLALEATAEVSPEQEKILQAIVHSAQKMSNIVDELLLLAEVRKTEAEVQPLDMASIVSEAQQRLAYMIGESGAEIVLPPAWPTALGYGPWVEEVWVNYLSNAIKYGGTPPRIELGGYRLDDSAAGEGHSVCFWVRDNGAGITLEDQARLFTPFTQLAQVRARGHGLGLSIVRRIVEKLGGQVGVESTPGVGSTFQFILAGTSQERRL